MSQIGECDEWRGIDVADLNYYLGPWQRDAELNAWTPPSGAVGTLDFGSLNDCALSPSAATMRGIGLFCTPRALTLPSEYDLLDSGDGREILITDAHRSIVEAVLGVRIEFSGTLAEGLAELFAAGDPTGQARWKPLTPTREGEYEIHFGGHEPEINATTNRIASRLFVAEGSSKIWSRKFAGPADKSWNRLRDLLRFDLKQHDDECRALAKNLRALEQQLRRDRRTADADRVSKQADETEIHSGRVLTWMASKYGCDPRELNADIKPQKPHTTISDDFSGDLSGWTVVSEGWVISGGRLGKTGSESQTGTIRHNTPLSAVDHYAQADCYWNSNNGELGACVRFSAVADTCYYETRWSGIDGYGRAFKRTSGASTALAYWALPVTTEQKIDCSGSTITVSFGANSGNVTDSSISTGLQCGLHANYTPNVYGIQLDNFYATDGIAPPATSDVEVTIGGQGKVNISGATQVVVGGAVVFPNG